MDPLGTVAAERSLFLVVIRSAGKWAWRGALIVLGLMALLWTGALLIGSYRLESKLEEFRKDPQYLNLLPRDWSKGGPGGNAAPYFSAAFALLSWPDSRDVALPINEVLAGRWDQLSESKRKAVADWVSQNEGAFNLARSGSERSWCRYYRSWDHAHSKPVPRSKPPEMGWIFTTEWMLISRAWVQSSNGAHNDARETLRVALAVADSLKDDPGLESQQTRLSAHVMVLGNLLKLVPAESTEADLDEWLKIVPQANHFDDSLDRAVRWETQCLVELLSSPLGRFWAEWGDHIPRYRQYEKSLQRRLADPLVKWDGVRALDELKEALRISRLPFAEGSEAAARMMSTKRSAGWNPVRANFVTSPLLLIEYLQTVRAQCVVLRTGIDWEKIRLKTGIYPDTCAAADPISGAPLRIEKDPPRLSSAPGRQHVIGMGWRIGESPAWVLRGK